MTFGKKFISRQLTRIFEKFFFLQTRQRTEDEVPLLAGPPAKIENSKNPRNRAGPEKRFFSRKSGRKSKTVFYGRHIRKGEVEGCRPTRISGAWVENRRSYALREKNGKKFKNRSIFEISRKSAARMLVDSKRRPEKNFRDFRPVISAVIKFFPENQVFSNFA